MPLLILAASIALLLLLIARWKWNAFLALLITSFAAGMANGLGAEATRRSILAGIGETMGGLVLILVFGAMLGKLVEESGAAYVISSALNRLLGQGRIQYAILLTGFLVGLPMIYNASFLVLIPLVYALSSTARLPLLYLGIPLSASLSVAHGYLPPHPAPTAIATMLGADVNRTLMFGLIVAVPAVLLAGPVLERFSRGIPASPPPAWVQPSKTLPEKLPGIAASVLPLLTPVLLMVAGAIAPMLGLAGRPADAIRFLSDPNVALFAAVAVGLYALGIARGRPMARLMESSAKAVSDLTMVILVIAAGGAFKQVLIDGGVAVAVQNVMRQAPASPILLAWGTAALLRLALGSATVAAITAGGVILPVAKAGSVSPELLVISITAGSLMFSHFNDIGFWMFKEYYNVSVPHTFRVWTVMESIVAFVGLAGAFLLHVILDA